MQSRRAQRTSLIFDFGYWTLGAHQGALNRIKFCNSCFIRDQCTARTHYFTYFSIVLLVLSARSHLISAPCANTSPCAQHIKFLQFLFSCFHARSVRWALTSIWGPINTKHTIFVVSLGCKERREGIIFIIVRVLRPLGEGFEFPMNHLSSLY